MSGKGAKGLAGEGAKGTIGIKGAGDKKKPISRSARAGASSSPEPAPRRAGLCSRVPRHRH
jgi:hypothetical protein